MSKSRAIEMYLKLRCRPLAFTSFKAFLKKQKQAKNYSPCLIFSKIFKEKYISSYILVTHRISLSGCHFFLEVLGNICVVIACFPGCDDINFEIDLNFLINPVSYITKRVRTKI